MSITEAQKRQLRKLGHDKKPVIIIGSNGLTDAVCAETSNALAHHELIKVKVNAGDRDERDAIIEKMCERTESMLIQRVGHIALIYRQHPENPKIEF